VSPGTIIKEGSDMHRSLLGLLLALLLVGCGGESSVAPAPVSSEPSPDEVWTVKTNVNTATREEFLALPEVTERMAHEFDEYRPYASIRQFRREIGKYVDEAEVERLWRYVVID